MTPDYCQVCFRMNPELSISRWENHENYFVEDKRNAALFTIGENEYFILRLFDGSRNFSDVTQEIKHHNLDVNEETLRLFIQQARELDILIRAGDTPQEVRSISLYFRTVLQRVDAFLLLFRPLRRVSLTLKGNARMFRILSIDLTDSSITKLIEKLRREPRLAIGFCIGIISCFVLGVYLLSVYGSDILSRFFLPRDNLGVFFIFFFSLSLFLGMLHELGHFVIYKYYGGQQNELGLGVLFSIIPLFYVNLNDSYLFKKRGQRILTLLGGPLADAFVLISGLLLILFTGNLTVLMASSALSLAACARIVLNLNPFLPGTDPYFILCELFGTYNLWKRSVSKLKTVISFKGITQLRGHDAGYYGFALAATLSIALQWGIAILLFYFPFVLFLLSMLSIEIF